MKYNGSVSIVIHAPEAEAGKKALAQRVSEIHAEQVHRQISRLNCSSSQKQQLLNAVIATAGKDDISQF